MHRRVGQWLPAAAAAVVVLTVPLWLRGPYHQSLAITIGMYAIAALGARLLLLLGLWSFGQGVFLTIGAYTVAILVVDMGLSFWAVLPVAAVGGALAAAGLGYPALRLRGVYFAIFTMVTVFAVRQGIILSPDVTRGAAGFAGVPRPDSVSIGSLELSFNSREALYYIVAVLLLLTLGVMYRIDHSRIATVLAAIRQGDVLAESIGINLTRYRVGAFVIAAFFTTAAGAFSATFYNTAHPEVWGLWPSIFIITYAIIGGTGSVLGPVLGVIVGVVAVEALRATAGWQGVFFGIALIVVMFVMPGGLTSVLSKSTLDQLLSRVEGKRGGTRSKRWWSREVGLGSLSGGSQSGRSDTQANEQSEGSVEMPRVDDAKGPGR